MITKFVKEWISDQGEKGVQGMNFVPHYSDKSII